MSWLRRAARIALHAVGALAILIAWLVLSYALQRRLRALDESTLAPLFVAIDLAIVRGLAVIGWRSSKAREPIAIALAASCVLLPWFGAPTLEWRGDSLCATRIRARTRR